MNPQDSVDFLNQIISRVQNGLAVLTEFKSDSNSDDTINLDVKFIIYPGTTHIPWWELKKFGGWR